MTRLFIFVFAFVCLSSCTSLQPHIWDRRDDFTGVRKRSMYVGASDNSLLLDALYAASASPSRPRTAPVPITHFLTLIVEEGDTMLTFIRYNPTVAYDIPADSKMQLLMVANGQPRRVVDMHLMQAYHTIGGPIIATGRVERGTVQALLQQPIDAIRIEKVSTNQADLEAVDWYPTVEYREAFQKGVGMLFAVKPDPKPTAVPKPKKPKKLYYYK